MVQQWPETRRAYYQKNKEKLKAYSRTYHEEHKEEMLHKMQQRNLKNKEKNMYQRAKSRAKLFGHSFTIELSDIVIPEYCPILGIKLTMDVKQDKSRDSLPSLDRIDNSKGYVKGNVQVISYKANRYKSDMTVKIIKSLYDYALSVK